MKEHMCRYIWYSHLILSGLREDINEFQSLLRMQFQWFLLIATTPSPWPHHFLITLGTGAVIRPGRVGTDLRARRKLCAFVSVHALEPLSSLHFDRLVPGTAGAKGLESAGRRHAVQRVAHRTVANVAAAVVSVAMHCKIRSERPV